MTAAQPPSGPLWLHEIKHDGFRVIARTDGKRVRLYSRPGNDLTDRSPLMVQSMARLLPCTIGREAVRREAEEELESATERVVRQEPQQGRPCSKGAVVSVLENAPSS